MEIEYDSNNLRKKLSSATEIKKAYGTMAQKISQRLAEIRASPNLSVLMTIPAANCHALINRNGDWALSISGNYRLIFKIANNPIPKKEDDGIDTIKVTDIIIMGTEDYH
jgi:plasmid maintenance system killer protein